ncbi:MAG: DNA methyltransferase [Armatimonadota bacterium]
MREVLIGNCRDKLKELPAESVQCVVTSPPYWGLRRYDGEQGAVWGGEPDCEHAWQSRRYYVEQSTGATGREAFAKPGEENIARLKAARWREDSTCTRCGAWYGAFGLEPTPEQYVANTLEILRGIRRVLRPDGVIWWNLGDSYAGSGQGWQQKDGGSIQRKWLDAYGTGRPPGYISSASPTGLKPKDLTLIPARVALGAQADGWWVRAMVIWDKPNTMPESVKDRPTESHEYILLLTKSEHYFYDADAVREPLSETTVERNRYPHAGSSCEDVAVSRPRRPGEFGNPAGRNLRSVWRFATIPYMGAHFAVFPPELPRRCVLAGSPPKACATCGAPWERRVAREPVTCPNGPGGNYVHKGRPPGGQESDVSSTLGKVEYYRVSTVGWQPTCECHGQAEAVQIECDDCHGTGTVDGETCRACAGAGHVEARVWSPAVLEAWLTRPPIVLDPFAGSGTTLMVAESLGRWWVGIDICADYEHQIRARTAQRSLMETLETSA